MVVAGVWKDRIYSLPCRSSCFAQGLGRIEEYNDLHQDDLKKRMNSSYPSKSS